MLDAPLKTLTAELDEVRASAKFARTAIKVRPQLGSLCDFNALQPQHKTLLLDFVNQKTASTDATYRGLYAVLAASFERFVRRVIVLTIEAKGQKAGTFDKVADTLKKRNMQLTGQVLSHVFEPRDEADIDSNTLCVNLGTCVSGAGSFRFNAEAFAFFLPPLSAKGFKRILETRLDVDKKNVWDLLGAPSSLQKALGTKGPRETGKEIQRFLADLARRRNRIVHGAAGEVTITETDLTEAIDVLGCFCQSLANMLKRLAIGQVAGTRSKTGG